MDFCLSTSINSQRIIVFSTSYKFDIQENGCSYIKFVFHIIALYMVGEEKGKKFVSQCFYNINTLVRYLNEKSVTFKVELLSKTKLT